MNEIEIAKIGESFYQVDRRKKLAIPTEFILSDANMDFYEEHCCTSNIKLKSAFSEYSKELVDKYTNTISINSGDSSVSIDDIAEINIDSLPEIYVNINGMIITIDCISCGEFTYSYQSVDEDFCTTSIVKDYLTTCSFIRLLEEVYIDFEYYLESYPYEDIDDKLLTADKLLFVFLFNLMLNTYIDTDTVEQVKNDIIEAILK